METFNASRQGQAFQFVLLRGNPPGAQERGGKRRKEEEIYFPFPTKLFLSVLFSHYAHGLKLFAKLFNLVEQLEGQRHTGKVDAKIALQACRGSCAAHLLPGKPPQLWFRLGPSRLDSGFGG